MSWRDVVRENPWLAPVVGATAVVVAFVTAGPIWGLFNLYLILFVGLLAFDHSRRLRKRPAAPEMTSTPLNRARMAGTSEPEPWVQRSPDELTHPLDLVPEMADSASTDTISFDEPPKRRRMKPDAYPVLDAFVASTNSDPEGVRSALEKWVTRAPSPDREREREALLQYWLFRAGDTVALDKLRALAAANPHLVEVGLYLHLALQDYSELWS